MSAEDYALEITEEDFEAALSEQHRRMQLEIDGAQHLGVSRRVRQYVEENLAAVLEHKFRRSIPSGYSLSEISIKFELKGQPLGVGVSGSASLKFTKDDG